MERGRESPGVDGGHFNTNHNAIEIYLLLLLPVTVSMQVGGK